ncbi:MAG: hypothetical protein HC866_01430 [Leptolyngbyaceae cyanobacterium RU_5_1]|nr:hypothetical protein [Leptolyngbyaceae cyanobacterium RU_5_1]
MLRGESNFEFPVVKSTYDNGRSHCEERVILGFLSSTQPTTMGDRI